MCVCLRLYECLKKQEQSKERSELQETKQDIQIDVIPLLLKHNIEEKRREEKKKKWSHTDLSF